MTKISKRFLRTAKQVDQPIASELGDLLNVTLFDINVLGVFQKRSRFQQCVLKKYNEDNVEIRTLCNADERQEHRKNGHNIS